MADNKGWIVTDDDCMQMRREIKPGVFMLFQVIEHPTYFRVAYGVIDANDCDEEEREDLVRTYGIDESELEGPDGAGILAEMMFETKALNLEIPKVYATFSDAVRSIMSFTGVDLSSYIPDEFHERGEKLTLNRIYKCLKEGVYEEIERSPLLIQFPKEMTPELLFEMDIIGALKNEFALNDAQARAVYQKSYETGHHAGFFEVLNAARNYGSFAATILNAGKPEKEEATEQVSLTESLPGELKMRIPTNFEWTKLVGVTCGRDEVIHWKDKLTWVHDEDFEKEYSALRAYRGYFAPRFRDYSLSFTRDEKFGFRPAFYLQFPDSLPAGTQNGDVVAAGTLYMDGGPVRVPRDDEEDGETLRYIPGTKLTFGPALDDPAFVVKAIAVDGVFIADRVLLCDISYDDIVDALS